MKRFLVLCAALAAFGFTARASRGEATWPALEILIQSV